MSDQIQYRIYRVDPDDDLAIRVVESRYTSGPATDEEIQAWLIGLSGGEYVVYPDTDLREFTVTSKVERTK